MRSFSIFLFTSAVLLLPAVLFLGSPSEPPKQRGQQLGLSRAAELPLHGDILSSETRKIPATSVGHNAAASPPEAISGAPVSSTRGASVPAKPSSGKQTAQSLDSVETARESPADSLPALAQGSVAAPFVDEVHDGLAQLSLSPPRMVPPGARLPVVFLDLRALPIPQRRALDRMANDFIDAIDSSGEHDYSAWEAAREAADRQYIKFYGQAAYNALHLQAAKEAVRERRATARSSDR